MSTPVERELRVMGSPAFLQVHGGDDALLDMAAQRLHELESLWSRFLPDSDITRANQAAGDPVVVHEDTLAVVGRALDGWRQTHGRFDITVLPALLAAGYTRSTVDGAAAPLVPGTRIGQSALVQVDHVASTLTVPPFGAIDLGGIGKGFAADIVVEELMEAGAVAALANIGGDIAVLGTPSDGPYAQDGVWLMGIADPRAADPHRAGRHVALFRMVSGGVATSGTGVRAWTAADGVRAHHLIDPVLSRPAHNGVLAATVLANDTATAEIFATAATVLSAGDAIALLHEVGLAGLVVTDDGATHATSTLKDFLA